MTAMLGLPASAVAQVTKALETKPRLPVLWFHFQECTCCSESFIRSSHPVVADVVLDKISLDYTETLMAASGKQAEEALHEHDGKIQGRIPDAGRRRGAHGEWWRLLLHRRSHRTGHREGSRCRREGGDLLGQLR